MANELKDNFGMTFKKSGAKSARIDASMTVDVAGKYSVHDSASIATSDTVLGLGAIGTIGVVFFKNLDSTNFVTIGEDGSSYPIQVNAGEWSKMRWNGAAIHAIADTAAIDLEYFILEN